MVYKRLGKLNNLEKIENLLKQRRLVGYIVKRSSVDKNEHSDLIQDTFVAAFKSIESLKDVTKLKQWLTSITLNIIKQWKRNRSSRIRLYFTGSIEFDTLVDQSQEEKLVSLIDIATTINAMPKKRMKAIKVLISGKKNDKSSTYRRHVMEARINLRQKSV